jgi:hypothetical protein
VNGMGWGVGRTNEQAKKDQKKRDRDNAELRKQAKEQREQAKKN